MSPSSDLEQEMEINGEAIINQQEAIHEYSFGIMSSDRTGTATMVGISEPYKKRISESESSTNDDSISSEGFQSWSMSMYQNLYHSAEFHEEEDRDGLNEDDNNNLTELASSAPANASYLREYRRHASGSGGMGPIVINKKPSLTRRWSTSSLFGGGKSVPQQVRHILMDPDDVDFKFEPESPEGWLSSITHIPDKIRQHMADKHRFNVKNVPREQLKQLYCY